MKDTYVVKTDNLKKIFSSLEGEHTNFTNGTRKTFSSGYLFDCSDATIVSMRNNIDNYYKSIDKAYNNIKKWLDDYTSDCTKLETSLQNGKANVSNSATNSYLRSFVDKNNVKIEETSVNFKLEDVETTATKVELSDAEALNMLSSLSDEQLVLVRKNLGLKDVGKADKSLDELKKELSAKTGQDYSNSSKEFIVMQCVNNGVELQRDKTREESLNEAAEKIKADYGSIQAFIQEAQTTNYSAYRTHKKGSMFDYSKVSTLDDYEFKRLCDKLGVNASDKDMGQVEMVKALQNKGLDIHTGEKTNEELKELCKQYGVDYTGGKTREQLEVEVAKALENKEVNQYFGLTPSSEEEKQRFISYEGKVDYTKYESLSDEELKKLAEGKGINTKIYTRDGLIKEVAEKDWNVYSTYGNGKRDLSLSAATQQAWSEGYSSIAEQAEDSKRKYEDLTARMAEGEKYGNSWRAFIDYRDTDGFYRDYANKYNLSKEERDKLMKQAYKGERDEEILDREVRGIDNRSVFEKVVGTGADLVIGVGEGLCGAVEAVSDGITFIGGNIVAVGAMAFGADYDDVMDPIKEHIATDYTGEIFNYVYEDTAIGQYAAKNSVNHEAVRGFGNTLGQVGGTVIMMSTGAGLAVPFLSGFGGGLQDAFASGQTGWDAVGGAVLKGVYNAAQYGVGAKFATAAYSSAGEKVAVNVMVDVVDAATTVPIETAIQMTYADGYYDPKTGEYIEFTDDMSWGEKYAKVFEQNGGVGAVMQYTAVGAVFSLGFNLGGEFRAKGKNKVDVDAKAKADANTKAKPDEDMSIKGKDTEKAKRKAEQEQQRKQKQDEKNTKYREKEEEKARKAAEKERQRQQKQQEKARKEAEEARRKQQETEYKKKQEEFKRQQEEYKKQQEKARKEAEKARRKQQETEYKKKQEEFKRQQEEYKRQQEEYRRQQEQNKAKNNNQTGKGKRVYTEEEVIEILDKMKLAGESDGGIMFKLKEMYEAGELGEGKSLYRKLAKKYHQDVNLGNEYKAKAEADAKAKAEAEARAKAKAEADAKAKAEQEARMKANKKIKPVDEQIKAYNEGAKSGKYSTIEVRSFDDISIKDINKMNNPQNMKIKLDDGKIYTYDDYVTHQYKKLSTSNSLTISERIDLADYLLKEGRKNVTIRATVDELTVARLKNMNSDIDIIIGNQTYTPNQVLAYHSAISDLSTKGWDVTKLKSNQNLYDIIYTNVNTPSKFEVDNKITHFLKLSGMDDASIAKIIKGVDTDNYQQIINLSKYKYLSSSNHISDKFFRKNAKNYTYGADQGYLKSLFFYEDKLTGDRYTLKKYRELPEGVQKRTQKVGNNEYYRIKNKLMAEGYSSFEASKIISGIDDAYGACSYADFANKIFSIYANNPAKFEADFGMPMYVNVDGKMRLNYGEFIVDTYVDINKIENGGKIIDGTNKMLRFDKEGRLDAENQIFMHDARTMTMNTDAANGYLKRKGIPFEYKSDTLINSVNAFGPVKPLSINEIRAVAKNVDANIKAGKQCTIYTSTNPYAEVKMHDLDSGVIDTTASWLSAEDKANGKAGAHVMHITDVTKDGFVVSSWGRRWLIRFDELTTGQSFGINNAYMD